MKKLIVAVWFLLSVTSRNAFAESFSDTFCKMLLGQTTLSSSVIADSWYPHQSFALRWPAGNGSDHAAYRSQLKCIIDISTKSVTDFRFSSAYDLYSFAQKHTFYDAEQVKARVQIDEVIKSIQFKNSDIDTLFFKVDAAVDDFDIKRSKIELRQKSDSNVEMVLTWLDTSQTETATMILDDRKCSDLCVEDTEIGKKYCTGERCGSGVRFNLFVTKLTEYRLKFSNVTIVQESDRFRVEGKQPQLQSNVLRTTKFLEVGKYNSERGRWETTPKFEITNESIPTSAQNKDITSCLSEDRYIMDMFISNGKKWGLEAPTDMKELVIDQYYFRPLYQVMDRGSYPTGQCGGLTANSLKSGYSGPSLPANYRNSFWFSIK